MSMGLSNHRLDTQLFLEIVREFRKFIAGGGTSNNLLSFMDAQDGYSEEKLLDTFQFQNATTEIETEDQLVKDQIMYTILDNTKYACMMSDIISGKAFSSLPDVDLSKSLLTYYEPAAGNLKNSSARNNYDPDFENNLVPGSGAILPPGAIASVRKMVQPFKVDYRESITPGDSLLDGDDWFFKEKKDKDGKAIKNNEGVVEKELQKGHWGENTLKPEAIYINGGANEDINITQGIPEPSRLSSPGLGAFVIRKPDMGITARNSDPINIFFNGISNIEMSRCVPYINIAVVTMQDETKPKKMNNVTLCVTFKSQGRVGIP